jgi:hypothetical protein
MECKKGIHDLNLKEQLFQEKKRMSNGTFSKIRPPPKREKTSSPA